MDAPTNNRDLMDPKDLMVLDHLDAIYTRWFEGERNLVLLHNDLVEFATEVRGMIGQ